MKHFLVVFFQFVLIDLFNRIFWVFLIVSIKGAYSCYLVSKKLLLKLECRILRDLSFKKCFLDIGSPTYTTTT